MQRWHKFLTSAFFILFNYAILNIGIKTMNKKNYFKKHKSRKFRKPKTESNRNNYWGGVKENQEEDRKVLKKQKQGDKENKTTASSQAKKREVEGNITSDFKKVLTVFLIFVILLVALWIMKIKTSFFNIVVDYLYRIFAL